jgi:hypothetical protein
MGSEMQEGIYVAQLLAGFFYIGVGARLLRLAHRTREIPERLLGLYFVATGVSYTVYFIPDFLGSPAFAGAWQFASRLAYLFAVVAILTFTRVAFRPDDRWAKGLVGLLTLVMCGGLMTSAAHGAWRTGVESAGWWLEFGGYSAALVWFAWEAFSAWTGARKRMRIGLCDGVVVDRFFLVALFGAFQVGGCVAEVAMEFQYAASHAVSTLADAALGAMELAGITILWLAFLSPEWYQRWVSRRLSAAAGSEG